MPFSILNIGIVSVPSVPTYVGPGDVVSGAVAWWGLCAYSAAAIGSNATRLRRDSDNNEQDFITLSNGSLDVSSVSSFKGAANLFVTKLYDQTGNAHDIVQATAARQPALLLSVLGSLPSVSFTSANTHQMSVSTGFAQDQPFTLATVSKYINNSAQAGLVGGIVSGRPQLFYNPTGTVPNTVGLYTGVNVPTAPASDGSFHSVIGIYDDAGIDSQIVVDGVSAGVTLGNTAGWIANDTLGLGNDNEASGTTPFNGNFQELGLWSSVFSAGQQSLMNSNRRSYWGF